jgi:replication factor A2
LKAFRDKRNVMAYNIRLVEDFNEVTHHFLEVVQFYCKVKTDDFGPGQSGGMGGMGNVSMNSGGGNVSMVTPGTALSAGTAPMNNSNDPNAKFAQEVQ